MQNRKIHRAMAFASKIAFACFALIRRWRDTFPTRGKATAAVPHCQIQRRFRALLRNCTSVIEKQNEKNCTAERSLPPGGEGGAPATDEGETGERTRAWRSSVSLPPGGGRKTASSLREATDEGETGERAIRATYAHEPADTKIPGKPTSSVSFRQGAAYPVRGW